MDRVGIGWRPRWAPTLLPLLSQLDVLEVLADDFLGASQRALDPLRLVARHVPLLLHGTGLGLASASALPSGHLDRLARLCAALEPEAWTEHLAFVRADGIEIGHLAAPPRTADSVEHVARNVEQARRVVGLVPHVENVATLIDPPGSTDDEPTWLRAVLAGTPAPLLLDLHNLHANAESFGWSATAALELLPLDRVSQVHVAGGSWVTEEHTGGRRLLDDHRHEVPPAVYQLLRTLAGRVRQPLTVILERDGACPGAEPLLEELARVREALALGRSTARRR